MPWCAVDFTSLSSIQALHSAKRTPNDVIGISLSTLSTTMSSWFLFEENDSWCVVHEKNVLRAGSIIKIGEICKFFYQGAQYDGKVLMIDGKLDVHVCLPKYSILFPL